MVNVLAEIQDLTTGEEMSIILPCDIDTKLEQGHEYEILYCVPEIPLGRTACFDVCGINQIFNDINEENPILTEEHLSMFLTSAGTDISDEGMVEKLKNNDFFFADISDIKLDLSGEEIAARYLATEIGIPFSREISMDMMNVLTDDTVIDYLNWENIWRQYELMGFKLIENFDSHDYQAYIISWK